MGNGRVYSRLDAIEREDISRMLAMGCTQNEIAEELGRHKSTISREIGGRGFTNLSYRADLAQKRANRQSSARKKGKRILYANERLREYVEEKLKMKWSPEQIAKRLKKDYNEDMEMRISHEAIYSYVYVLPKGTLKQELTNGFRRKHKRRHKKRKTGKIERPLKDMVSIDDRPNEVEGRKIFGHWEGDLIIGKNRQSALGTLTERKTRFGLLVRVRGKSAKEIKSKFARKFKSLPSHAKLTLTYDQGREMADHVGLTKSSKVKVYFAHKSSPWERGTNENFNGLVRQFFPKGTDFNKVTYYQIQKAQALLNGRPRRVLDYDTPYEAFAKEVALNF